MTRRKRKLGPNEWVFIPAAPPQTPPIRDYEILEEDEVKTACAVALLFMLLHVPRTEKNSWFWYKVCAEAAWSYPQGSYRHVFWWSMRILRDPRETLEGFSDYMKWKLEEFDSGRIRREGPRW